MDNLVANGESEHIQLWNVAGGSRLQFRSSKERRTPESLANLLLVCGGAEIYMVIGRIRKHAAFCTEQGSLGRKDGPEADGEARGVQPQRVYA